jgi:hypothetical protein
VNEDPRDGDEGDRAERPVRVPVPVEKKDEDQGRRRSRQSMQ